MKRLKSYKALQIALLTSLPFTMFAKSIDESMVKKAMSGAHVFVENKGQVIDQNNQYRKDIDFRLNTGGMDVFVGDGALHYQWSANAGAEGIQTYRLDVELIGANLNAPIVTSAEGRYKEFYYTDRFPGGMSVSSFEKVTYRNVYPNIDWVLYTTTAGEKRGLKYDFVVRPGGNPGDIKLKYSGASSLSMENGMLTAKTPMGSITEAKPYSYDALTKEEIPSSFILQDNILSFNVTPSANTLVIDPELLWKTYMGGNAGDPVNALAADGVGNGYVGGATLSTALATFGAAQQTYGGGTQDGYVIKFDTLGTALWATYYGGNAGDVVNGLAVDHNGNVFVAGQTLSTNRIASSSGAVQGTIGGGPDGFLAKLTASGGFAWGTYYGGSGDDNAYAVACDRTGNVFVAGSTESTNNIASSNGYRTTPARAFLAKFTTTGARNWGTYVADTGQSAVRDIACDLKGNVYCVGYTSSYQQIATSGSHQPANGGGTVGPLHLQDAFLIKYNGNGGREWGTYYGGNNYDDALAVDCDDRGGIYIGGVTASANGTSIATAGAYQSTFTPTTADVESAFIAKFNENGTRIWGTYNNTGLNDNVTDLKVIPGGSIFVSGYRYVNGANPPPPYTFLTRLGNTGTPNWLTERLTDIISAKLAYSDGKIYFGATMTLTDSATLPSNLSGASDAFIIRYAVDTVAFILQPFGDSVLCIGDTLKVPFDVTNKFNSGNIVRLQMSDVSGNFSNSTTLTSITTDSADTFKYVIPVTITEGKGYKVRLVTTTPVDTSYDNIYQIRIADYPDVGPVAIFPICANGTLQLSDSGVSPSSTIYEYTGPGSFFIAANSYNRPNVQITDSGWYVLTGDNYGCVNTDSVHVTVIPKPNKPTFTTNSPVCQGDTLRISVSSTTPGANLFNMAFYRGSSPNPIWYNADVSGDTVIVSAALTDTGRYVAVALHNGCPSDPETTKVVVNPTVIPTVQINPTPGNFLGPWQSISFNVTGSSNTGTAPGYQWTRNGTDIPGATGTTFMGTTGIDLLTGDTICLRMTSNAQCAKPTVVKNCVGIEIDLGVDDPALANRYQLFPNPNNGRFTLQSGVAFKGEEVIVTNSLGQEVYRGITGQGTTKAEIDLGIMPNGMYLLRTTADGKPVSMKFTISE